jgi:hypothetical protein
LSSIEPALAQLRGEIASLSADLGRRVDVAALGVSDRAGQLVLKAPGRRSPNRACRLVQAADGWIAVNLAREDDRDLVAAWVRGDFGVEPWRAIALGASARGWRDLVSDAVMLGLPVAGVGEMRAADPSALLRPFGGARVDRRAGRLRAVDLSALWAGPMCGAILAEMGVAVTKVESVRRPDPTRTITPDFFRRLNGAKSELALDLTDAAGQARLREEIAAADILITSVRPRGLTSLGLSLEAVFAANPGLIWVAITGYGWTGPSAARVAFGDDAAAAGGLVRWSRLGAPRFLGDALADPVTGMAAAAAALKALQAGRGMLVDAALARCAAGAASVCGLRANA